MLEFQQNNDYKFKIHCYENIPLLIGSNVKEFDIFFLDIKINDNNSENGITVAEKIKKENSKTIIIFITSYNNYIDDIFRIKAFRYLSKPIDTDRFNEAVDYALYELCERPIHILVNNYGNGFKIYVNNILHIYVKNRKTILLTYNNDNEKIYECDEKLTNIIDQLNGHRFCEIYNKKYINLKYVVQYDTEKVTLMKGEYKIILPVSRRCYKNFLQAFIEYGGSLR